MPFHRYVIYVCWSWRQKHCYSTGDFVEVITVSDFKRLLAQVTTSLYPRSKSSSPSSAEYGSSPIIDSLRKPNRGVCCREGLMCTSKRCPRNSEPNAAAGTAHTPMVCSSLKPSRAPASAYGMGGGRNAVTAPSDSSCVVRQYQRATWVPFISMHIDITGTGVSSESRMQVIGTAKGGSSPARGTLTRRSGQGSMVCGRRRTLHPQDHPVCRHEALSARQVCSLCCIPPPPPPNTQHPPHTLIFPMSAAVGEAKYCAQSARGGYDYGAEHRQHTLE